MEKRKTKRFLLWVFAAVAVLLVLLAAAAVWIIRGNSAKQLEEPGLPILDVSVPDGLLNPEIFYQVRVDAYEMNPWTEDMEIETLPVFKNNYKWESYSHIEAVSPEIRKERVREIADAMGIRTLWISDFTVDKDSVTIEAAEDGSVEIYFDTGVKIPEEYNLSDEATHGDISAVAEYFKKEYGYLPGMENAVADINASRYSTTIFFEDGETNEEKIVNYSLKRMKFISNFKDGGYVLKAVAYLTPDLSTKLGDYPIISLDKAKSLLISGKYLAPSHAPVPKYEDILWVELVYKQGQKAKYYMPYYVFFMEFKHIEGRAVYGTYFIPAVKDYVIW